MTIYHRLLNDKNSEKFFRVFHDRILNTIKEIRILYAKTSVSSVEETCSSVHLNDHENLELVLTILRFLQLLCENHNLFWQNYLREQKNNAEKYNLVYSVLQLLDALCGSLTGGHELLSLWVNESSIELINQSLDTLIEYCQGPSQENQRAIISHETNEIDLIIALVFLETKSLPTKNLLELKDKASKLLLALLESNDDLTNGERIISGIKLDDLLDEIKNVFNHKSPNNSIQMEYILKFISKLIDKFQEVFPNAIEVSQSISPRKAHYFNRIWSQTFKFIKEKLLADSQIAGWVNRWKDIKDEQLNIQLNKQDDNDNTNDDDDDDDDQLAADVGHNLYMLSHQLAKFNKDFASKLKQTSKEEDENGALTYYAAHTAQIEVLFCYYIEKIRFII